MLVLKSEYHSHKTYHAHSEGFGFCEPPRKQREIDRQDGDGGEDHHFGFHFCHVRLVLRVVQNFVAPPHALHLALHPQIEQAWTENDERRNDGKQKCKPKYNKPTLTPFFSRGCRYLRRFTGR